MVVGGMEVWMSSCPCFCWGNLAYLVNLNLSFPSMLKVCTDSWVYQTCNSYAGSPKSTNKSFWVAVLSLCKSFCVGSYGNLWVRDGNSGLSLDKLNLTSSKVMRKFKTCLWLVTLECLDVDILVYIICLCVHDYFIRMLQENVSRNNFNFNWIGLNTF